MRTYISDIIPRIQRFSQKLDNLTLLANQHWVVIDDIDKSKVVYIFRQNSELLISQNGIVERGKWEYLGNNSLLIDQKEKSFLFKHGFFDENILALKIDSKNEYAFLVNETTFEKELNSSLSVIEFLNKKYIEPSIRLSIQDQSGLPKSSSNLNASQIYLAPNYTLKKTNESNFLFGVLTEQYLVAFEDGEIGEVFYEKHEKLAYFKAIINEMWLKSKIYYENIDFCIAGLHYFLKNGKISQDGFIAAYA